MNRAAEYSTNKDFSEYLNLQAKALRTPDPMLDAYADKKWATLQDTPLEFTITRENYSDELTESVIENEELKKLLAFVDSFKGADLKNPTTVFLRSVCEYLAQDMEYYRMIIKTNIVHNFLNRLINIFYEKTVKNILEANESVSATGADIYLSYTSAGASMVIISWLNGDITATPKEVAEKLSKLVESSKKVISM